ncbi:cell division cycle protein 123 homolog [Mytilus californianus]|uniref:cell division cycle protein 123 homolog n=1 Tax=Mytilus californianus TaxID=6549 RepID=UPI0022483C1F|nr:cell division cycle protein 123 homolog [Mytilus californianus]
MAENLVDQLKHVKLKKIKEPTHDFSGLKTSGYLTEDEIKDYDDNVLAANTEHWIHMLQDVTFPTVTAPFHLEDAQLFIDVYTRLYENKDSSESIDLDWQTHLKDEEKRHVNTISERLEKAMSIYTTKGYAFVKLSSRSAKDAPLIQKRFKSLYINRLSAVEESEKGNENVKIMCLLQAGFDALRVKMSFDVIDMFIRSERVFQDLLLAVKHKDNFNENFIIREFVDIDVDMEFRGFVFDGELNALSQYNYLLFSKRLNDKKEEISCKIREFFNSVVKPRLKAGKYFLQNFVIDFAVTSSGKKGALDKLWVIEINPFLNTTDGALFSWEKERDILEGKQGFQVRIVQQAKPGSLTMMPQSIRELLKST